MKLRRLIALASTAALLSSLILTTVGIGAASAATSKVSPSKVDPDTTKLIWSGQGSPVSQECDPADPGAGGLKNGATADSYLLWIFSTDGGSISGSPTLTIDGTTYTEAHFTSGVWQIVTPGYDAEAITEAYVSFTVASTGNGAWILTISHGCTAQEDKESLKVSKTAATSFDREHFWDIAKKVETEDGWEHDGYPKVWLWTDGRGDETATWTVDVTYEGYKDSKHNVSGTITIENDGEVDAVITSIVDLLGGVAIEVDCGMSFALPYTLPVGETLACTYDEDGYVEGVNTVTVTTERHEYFAYAEIVWSDPANEKNKTVSVKDISDLFGEVALGTVTAPNDGQFTYTKAFAWADYGAAKCGDFTYENEATIVETGQSADATLKVNVQCLKSDSAWAKGSPNLKAGGPASAEVRCFTQDGFSNWGWTNKINATGTYKWTLWAGAAKCDTSKGFNAGTVTFKYDTATGKVTYISFKFAPGYTGTDMRLYSGADKYPKVGGKFTTAPGAYKNYGNTGYAWVIAHAKVWYPDPSFGPQP